MSIAKTGFLVAAIMATMALAPTAKAQSVRLLGDYNDWSAYTTSQGAAKLCFVLSKPKDVQPRPDNYTESYLYLTHRPGESVRNEFNFVAGYPLSPQGAASINIGGASFPLFIDADAAWLDDPAQSDNLAGNMRAGSSLSIENVSASGEKVVQTFSLSGVTAASRAIDQECG